ncbi:MAG: YceI family protein [Parvularculaceae bacterium]
MRRRSTSTFAVALVAVLAACGAKEPQSSPAPEDPAAAEAPTPVAESVAPVSAAPPASGPPSIEWTVDMTTSRLGFSASQTGKPFEGQFEKFDAKIAFDPADLSKSSIDVAIDMTSAKTGDRQRDQALPGSDWFKTKDFPTARFAATEVEEAGEGRYIAHGSLTIRDATKPIDLPFSLEINGDAAHAQGEATLMRVDFGVGQGEFATDEFVGLEVRVIVDVTATR